MQTARLTLKFGHVSIQTSSHTNITHRGLLTFTVVTPSQLSLSIYNTKQCRNREKSIDEPFTKKQKMKNTRGYSGRH